MITEQAKAIGALVYFAREGKEYAAPSSGTVDGTVMPDADDDVWVLIGRIESWEMSMLADEEQDVYDSSTGLLTLADSVPTKQAIQYKFTTNEVTALAMGLIFRSATELTPASFQFNPLAGVSPRGFLKMQHYDHNSALVLAADVWGRIKCGTGWKGGDGNLVKPEFMFKQFKNSLNTMALGTA